MTHHRTTLPAEEDGGIRLSKRVAELKACSRREAEQYIEGGWVRVAGRVVEEPQFRVRGEDIAIDPTASLMAPPAVTILLHKPPGHDAGTGEPVDIKGLGKASAPHWIWSSRLQGPGRPQRHPTVEKHLMRQQLCTPLKAAPAVWWCTPGLAHRAQTDRGHGVIEQEFTVEVQGDVSNEALQRRISRRAAMAGPCRRSRSASAAPAMASLDCASRSRVSTRGWLPTCATRRGCRSSA
jgi:23S rRNA pseudouridine2604 synthase